MYNVHVKYIWSPEDSVGCSRTRVTDDVRCHGGARNRPLTLGKQPVHLTTEPWDAS